MQRADEVAAAICAETLSRYAAPSTAEQIAALALPFAQGICVPELHKEARCKEAALPSLVNIPHYTILHGPPTHCNPLRLADPGMAEHKHFVW